MVLAGTITSCVSRLPGAGACFHLATIEGIGQFN